MMLSLRTEFLFKNRDAVTCDDWTFYRGFAMRVSDNDMYLFAVHSANALVRLAGPFPRPQEDACFVVDVLWPDLMAEAARTEAVSWDGLPWALHSIDDPSARSRAIDEFLDERSRLE